MGSCSAERTRRDCRTIASRFRSIIDDVKDIAEISKLPLPERLRLVGAIWETILDDPALLPVSEELARELEFRLAAHRADPGSSQTWESVDREVFGSD